MTGFFKERGYPRNVIDTALRKCRAVSRTAALTPKNSNQGTKIPIVLGFFDGVSQQISRIMHQNGRILARDPEIGFLFDKNFVTAYKNEKSVRQFVVRSKLPEPIDEIPGNFPCGAPRCKTCHVICGEPLVVGPTGSFEIRHSFNCKSSNVIYVIHCTRCDRSYVGETSRPLHRRKNDHWSDIKCKRTEKNEVAEHFCSGQHNLVDDFSIRAVLRVDDTHERTIMEAKLIKRLGTLQPLGLNKEVSTFHRR